MRNILTAFIFLPAPLAGYQKGKDTSFVAPNSSFPINFRFRMQRRAVYNTGSKDNLSALGL